MPSDIVVAVGNFDISFLDFSSHGVGCSVRIRAGQYSMDVASIFGGGHRLRKKRRAPNRGNLLNSKFRCSSSYRKNEDEVLLTFGTKYLCNYHIRMDT